MSKTPTFESTSFDARSSYCSSSSLCWYGQSDIRVRYVRSTEQKTIMKLEIFDNNDKEWRGIDTQVLGYRITRNKDLMEAMSKFYNQAIVDGTIADCYYAF